MNQFWENFQKNKQPYNNKPMKNIKTHILTLIMTFIYIYIRVTWIQPVIVYLQKSSRIIWIYKYILGTLYFKCVMNFKCCKAINISHSHFCQNLQLIIKKTVLFHQVKIFKTIVHNLDCLSCSPNHD